jgi:hypothetical protein
MKIDSITCVTFRRPLVFYKMNITLLITPIKHQDQASDGPPGARLSFIWLIRFVHKNKPTPQNATKVSPDQT